MLIRKENTDIILINNNGKILYDDIGNYRFFRLGMENARGKNIRELFIDINEDYPLIKAANEGIAFPDFECILTTERGIKLTKVGSAYPIFDGEIVVGAVEFTKFYYDRDHIREIEQHSEHLLYRKNNTKYLVDDIITNDDTMKEIKTQIGQMALSDSNVLIFGETGTGKELIAQSMHNSSRRFSKKFISQNCSAIPASLLEGLLFGTTKGSFTGATDRAGLFEMVEGGTVFLDEINSLEPDLQVKLLKVIESKKVRKIGSDEEMNLDFRIIAATNEDPYKLMNEGRLKPDLFYRLAVIYIKLPKLTERKNDIELLTRHFLNYFNEKTNSNVEYPSQSIMNLFRSYSWPGNVRELRNVIESAFSFAENNKIDEEDIPQYIKKRTHKKEINDEQLPNHFQQYMNGMEESIVLSVYNSNNENLTAAASALGISKQLLHYKLEKIKEGKKHGFERKV